MLERLCHSSCRCRLTLPPLIPSPPPPPPLYPLDNSDHQLFFLLSHFSSSSSSTSPSSLLQAVESGQANNKTHEEFHNSLGLCYRNLGRAAEAELQFHLALRLNPAFATAMYNLGLAYQDQGRLREAVDAFRSYNALASTQPLERPSEIILGQGGAASNMRLEGKIRECDLLQLLVKVEASLP